MSEAFFDVRTLNATEFSENPLKNFDRMCQSQNAYSGKMYTTAFGGGTIRTEFETVTGLTLDYLANGTSPYLYITQDTETYVSVLKSRDIQQRVFIRMTARFICGRTHIRILALTAL